MFIGFCWAVPKGPGCISYSLVLVCSTNKVAARNLERWGAFTQHGIEESEVFASTVVDRNPRRRRPPRRRAVCTKRSRPRADGSRFFLEKSVQCARLMRLVASFPAVYYMPHSASVRTLLTIFTAIAIAASKSLRSCLHVTPISESTSQWRGLLARAGPPRASARAHGASRLGYQSY